MGRVVATVDGLRFGRIVAGLPASVPFLAPEAIERKTGRPFTLRLGANESVFGASPLARAAMVKETARIAWYADPENYDLRTALARRLAVPSDSLLVGSGIDGLLGLLVRAFIDPGDHVVTSRGTYPTFNYHVAGFGGALHRVPYREDRQDLEALGQEAQAVSARLIYLANPDNPSGTCNEGRDILDLLDRLPPGCVLVLDEAYAEFATECTIPPIDAADPRLVRLRTFSKAHGMAGARIGYLIAAKPITDALNKIRTQFEVNRIAQAGALASLQDEEFFAGVVEAVADGRQALAALAAEIGCATIPSATNFVCIDAGGADRARAIVTALQQRSVFIRMPPEPPLNRCVRVTVGTPDQLARFADVFREVWESLP